MNGVNSEKSKLVRQKFCGVCENTLQYKQTKCCSVGCRNLKRKLESKKPPVDQLTADLGMMTQVAVGKKYGVNG